MNALLAASNASYSINSYIFLRPAPGESFGSRADLPSRDLASRVDCDWIAAHIDMDSDFGKQRVVFMDKHRSGVIRANVQICG